MGVPGFFMWLWKRYKGTNFVFNRKNLDKIKDKNLIKKLNSIDYLLVDTNCMIHPKCFEMLAEFNHITNKDKLENKMMNHSIEYLDSIVKYVDPKKGVFVAIDGVAPVAKIKQQRSRRFKSVHDRVMWNNIKKKHGKEIKNEWNNSAITPGTEFMRVLNNKVIDWAKKQSIEVIYSSSNTPSEGEHKLLQFIRENEKNKKKYSYVFYGLDADLIFLALATGLDDIYLLREAVHLNRNNPTDELNYVWIDKMRDSIYDTVYDMLLDEELEEKIIDKNLKRRRITDDFIFICYLLGNDFLPHLPSLDISKDGIDYLLEQYVEVFIENKFKYLIDATKKEKINQKVFENIISKLAKDEPSVLYENSNKRKRRYKSKSSDPYDIEVHRIDKLMFKIHDPIKLGYIPKNKMKDDDGSVLETFSEEWKARYYSHYFGTVEEDQEVFVEDMARHYLLGLKWVTEYYFEDCPSWDWYFPYDHPPFLEDVAKYVSKNPFKKFKFSKGKPLKPLMQLMCVLPPQSSFLLPVPLRKVMTNPNSSLGHLYPIDFEQDFIGKGVYWKAIPYLPSLEIGLVKRTFMKYEKKLNEEDKKRNHVIKNYEFNL